MDVGLVYEFRNPAQWARPFPELYGEILDEIGLADHLGFGAIWMSEHHFVADGYMPSVLPMAAAISARTHRVRVGTAVLLLPLHNPLRVAEDGAVVDILSNGRFQLGVGLGYRLGDFAGYGVSTKQRASLMEEGLEVIRRAWTQDCFSFDGRHHHVRELSLSPRPVQQPHPPIYVGAWSKPALRRCGRMGCNLLMVNASRSAYETYREALLEHGHDPLQRRVTLMLDAFVAEDPERAWHDIKRHCLYRHNVYQAWHEEAGQPWKTGALADPEQLPMSELVYDPESFVSWVEKLSREVPVDQITLGARYPGLSGDHSLRSVELVANKVIPRLAELGREVIQSTVNHGEEVSK